MHNIEFRIVELEPVDGKKFNLPALPITVEE
jgi:hypothetical protein